MAAIVSTKRLQAANSSARSGLAASGSTKPTSGASRAHSHSASGASGSSASTAARSLPATWAGSSDSRMPAWALTISPSAQKVIPSP